MTIFMEYVYALLSYATYLLPPLLLVALTISWLLTLIGLPGNWIMLALAILYAWSIPDSWRIDLGWEWVVALATLATIGELLEFLAGAVGTQQAGGSNRSAGYALAGSMLGGLAGAFVALPIPLVGPLLGAVVFSGVGAAVGAMYGELSQGTGAEHSIRVGQGAFWGRLLGTGAKTLAGSMMIAAVVVAWFV